VPVEKPIIKKAAQEAAPTLRKRDEKAQSKVVAKEEKKQPVKIEPRVTRRDAAAAVS